MNTDFWGPSAWIFLFAIASAYPNKIEKYNHEHKIIKKNYHLFFNVLRGILPCKYCRESYIEYYDDLPIGDYLSSRRSLQIWLYSIHDMVNQKLIRQQREKWYKKRKSLQNASPQSRQQWKQMIMKTNESPPFDEALRIMSKNYWGPHAWRFLFCIAFNYSLKVPTKELESTYRLFFELLMYMLPCETCRISYSRHIKAQPIVFCLKNQKSLMFWLYSIRDEINKDVIKIELSEWKSKIKELRTRNKDISDDEIEHWREVIVTTKNSPSFQIIYKHYANYKSKTKPSSHSIKTS